MNYEGGSFWRKWDLHVHSPFSVLNNGDFGNGFDTNNSEVINNYVYNLISEAIKNKISAIGITDYFMIEGYKAVRDVLKDLHRMKTIFKDEILDDESYLEKVERILFLPNIEFRLDLAVIESSKNGLKSSKFQLHVVFSDQIPINKIEDNFLGRLVFTKDIEDSKETKYTLTKNNFIEYGNNLLEHGIGGDGTPLFVGMNNSYVKLDEILSLLDNSEFKNNHIIILAEENQSDYRWCDQLAGIRRKMYKASDALFSSNGRTIKWGTSGESIPILEKLMPCIWGSDAHSFDKLFKPDLNRFTWLKADTTFEGLLISLKNPVNRIYIGESVEELINFKRRASYTIQKIKVNLKNDNSKSKVWFNFQTLLNPFMITVIGNKGAGKSALSDILGSLGNSYNTSYFSFLNNDRFLNRKTKYGSLYNTSLLFYGSKEEITKELSNEANYNQHELVKYLPQKYIEEVCNDLGDTFQKEINDSIFAYISPQEKGGATNLLDLIDSKIQANQNTLIDYRSKLEKINIEIRKLEERSTFTYKQEIIKKLEIQKNKYNNYFNLKPEVVLQPTEDFKHHNSELITILTLKVNELDEKIVQKIEESSIINNKITMISNFFEEVERIEKTVDGLNKEYLEIANKLDIDKNNFISIKLNDIHLKKEYSSLITKIESNNKLLDDTNLVLKSICLPEVEITEQNVNELLEKYNSLYDKKNILEQSINKLSESISIEEQNYLKYQTNLKNWDTNLKMILGTIPNTIDGESIQKYEKELQYIDSYLNDDLTSLCVNRESVINQIYEEYEKIITKYKILYSPIQERINQLMHGDIEKIEFEAKLKVNNRKLIDNIVEHIDTRTGSDFRGKSEAYREVDNIVSSTDFNDRSSVIAFIEELIEKTKPNNKQSKEILTEPTNFYNFISKLEFLNPEFSIVSGGRELTELSPGERGIVLLVFYLALSKENIPLIIDQPEDNLDNQSVFSRLVPAIIEAKKYRQVILVTHNPNIAIACDSEEIIYCSIDKNSGELKYESGSIENPKIKKYILDVLEGTKPAFNKRRETYDY